MMIKRVVSASLLLMMVLAFAGCSGISNGEDYVLVENYTDMDSQKVASDLNESFTLKAIDIFSSEGEAGKVVSQYPYAGRELNRGGELRLYISKGMPPNGLDVQGMEADEAEKLLMGEESVNFNKEYEFSVDVEEGYVIGLGEKAGAYTVYISKGKPEVSASGQPGYAVKAGGHIFYTDNEHIYKMNLNGTDEQRLVEINEIKEIVPYESFLIYLDEQNKRMCCYNYETNTETFLTSGVNEICKVLDGNVYYLTDIGLYKISLQTKREYAVGEGKVYNVVACNTQLFMEEVHETEKDVFRSDILAVDILTGESKVLAQTDSGLRIYSDNGTLYYLTADDLYSIDINSENNRKISDGIRYVYTICEDHALYYPENNNSTYLKNLISGEVIKVCDYGELLGLDRKNGWYYYNEDQGTYRIKSDGGQREYFCKEVLTPGYYTGTLEIFTFTDGLVFIDNWIYYFKDEVLSRLNVKTRVSEKIADNPTAMPWWDKI